jgi:hypothetical protein
VTLGCTPIVLPMGVVREITRPPELRQDGFNEQFDASTLFYDVIWLCDRACTHVLVGPPLRNLLAAVRAGRIDGRPLAEAIVRVYERDRCCDVWLEGRYAERCRLEFPFGTYLLTPSPARHELYAGKRVLYTLSRDNPVAWIVDWAHFHVVNHGADAVLLYDNASTHYQAADAQRALRSALPGIEVHVVDWPYSYGPGGVSRTCGWDSDFCQAGAFQDARFRFLARARAVLNCDVDELVLSLSGRSVFDAAERSSTACVAFEGRWVSSATRRASRADAGAVRHGDYRYLEPDGPRPAGRASPAGAWAPCPAKWCVVPRSCGLAHDWSVHQVRSPTFDASRSAEFQYRHFRAISTDWKYRRTNEIPIDNGVHRFDPVLDAALARAGM